MTKLVIRALSLVAPSALRNNAVSHVKWGRLQLAPVAVPAYVRVCTLSALSLASVVLSGANGTKWN